MNDNDEDRIICGFEGYETSTCLYLSSVSLFWYYRVMTICSDGSCGGNPTLTLMFLYVAYVVSAHVFLLHILA
jgi:hypothetical protein